jgi:hypothetical protein
MLNQYLETNQADLEAWQELADIYLSKQLYKMFSYYSSIDLKRQNFALKKWCVCIQIIMQ